MTTIMCCRNVPDSIAVGEQRRLLEIEEDEKLEEMRIQNHIDWCRQKGYIHRTRVVAENEF